MTEKEFQRKIVPMRRQWYSRCLRMGIPPDDAADIIQELQIKLWRNRNSMPELQEDIARYCTVALRNESIGWFRRRRETADISELKDVSADFTGDNEYADTLERVVKIIERLPASQREVIKMSSFGEMENSEIAETLGQSEVNVRQLLSRGRRKLKEMWNRIEKG